MGLAEAHPLLEQMLYKLQEVELVNRESLMPLPKLMDCLKDATTCSEHLRLYSKERNPLKNNHRLLP